MYWSDEVAQKLKERNLSLEWVDDMKTPSGRIHVGSLRGVVIHDLVYKSLKKAGVNSKYTYVFDDHDPMDDLPAYLPREFEKYLGMPLYKIPSPAPGFKNYAEYFALEFKDVFDALNCTPEILWSTELYGSGKMNDVIKECLNKASEIRKIYEELYKKELPNDWYPFQVYCTSCGKVSTTKVKAWDGEKVSFICKVDGLTWVKGCGLEGSVSPFSSNGNIAGKLPWKVEWAAKWKVIGVTVEGAGKDHMSKGGSHDLATLICERVINYPVPYPIAYEFFLVGGKKMSSSKGRGSSAKEILDILPPEILRFLMVRTKINQAINFDPTGDTIPKLFDEYQKAAESYFSKKEDDLARVFVLSQVEEVKSKKTSIADNIKKPPKIRFSTIAQWVQMPNMEDEIKKENAGEWVKYAKIWLEKYAPEEEKFMVQKELPKSARSLSDKQKEFLKKIASELNKEWSAEEFQTSVYNWAKEMNVASKEAYQAIYVSLLGKDHGPKAAWLILSLDREFVQTRFNEV